MVLKYDGDRLDQQKFMEGAAEGKLPKCFSLKNTCDFVYLSAERQGPRDIVLTQSQPLDEQEIGARGHWLQ